MSVWTTMNEARTERTDQLLKMPPRCAVSLTFANRGENEHGMEMIGGAASQLVTMQMLQAAKLQWESGNDPDGTVQVGEAELHDLSSMVDPQLVSACGGDGLGAGVLVLRGFAQRLLGPDAPAQIEHELEMQLSAGKVDSKALMRGQVKNKNARHNNVMAHFDQAPDHAAGKGTVVKIADYPFINGLTAQASMWMQQDNPLICEQNRYYDVEQCGIGWHGDGEREVVLGYRAGEATNEMPMMFQAFYWGEAVGPQTNLRLNRGDVYIMTSKAVGTDWKCSSKLTWRHAAGNPATCSYVETKVEKAAKSAGAQARRGISKAKKVVRKSPFLK